MTDDEKKQLKDFETDSSLEIKTLSPQIKEDVLDEWKKELSDVSGIEISGEEKVADVFVAIVNFRIEKLVEPDTENNKSEILPMIFSIILFITLLSIGSFISRFWTIFSAVIFWILRKIGLVEVITKKAKVETII